jgi:hypothetical protein
MGTAKRRKASQSTAPRGRGSKAFLLPMPRADADAMILRCRLALEAVRNRRAERSDVTAMAQVVLVTSLLTQAGHGTLPVSWIQEIEVRLRPAVKTGEQTGVWHMPDALIEPLTTIVNEHDRQLREVRVEAVLRATERLNRMILQSHCELAANVDPGRD